MPFSVAKPRASFKGARGFTLIELGIVIAVVAVLSVAVLMGRGFIETSKVSAAVQGIDAVRKAARLYAERQNGGASYRGIDAAQLASMNLVSGVDTNNDGAPDQVQTPWKTALVVSSATPFDQIVIEVTTPKPSAAKDIARQLNGVIGTATHSGSKVTITTR